MFLNTYREMLLSSVSYFDRNEENSYHTFLLGMCVIFQRNYIVKSNQETGKGRADILLQAKREGLSSYIIVLQYTKDQHQDLNKLASKAIQQFEDNQYGHGLDDSLIYIGLAHRNKDAEMSWKERK